MELVRAVGAGGLDEINATPEVSVRKVFDGVYPDVILPRRQMKRQVTDMHYRMRIYQSFQILGSADLMIRG